MRKHIVGSNSTNKEGTSYIKEIYKQMNNNKICEWTESLMKEVQSGKYDHHIAINELNIIYNMVTNIMFNSEITNCKKKEPATWTLELHQSILRIQYWNILIKTKSHYIDAAERLNGIKAR
jgi:hypothetical protein